MRELENAIESLVALSPLDALDLSLLPGDRSDAAAAASARTLEARVDAYERGLVVEALDAARGNRTEAAQAARHRSRDALREAQEVRDLSMVSWTR